MTDNKFAYKEKIPEEKDLFVLSNTKFIKFTANQYQKGWYNWDSDNDGLADALEKPGDADGDGLENKFDSDSNNNGINDFEEFRMARNPFGLKDGPGKLRKK